MKVCVLYNPKSGTSGQLDAVRAALARLPGVRTADFRTGDDLKEVARQAARERFDVIAVAGGDGTVHVVANALAPDFPRVPLAVIPLGTGNDFCRTLNVPLDPAEAVKVLRTGKPRRLDVAAVQGGFTGVMVNAATGGFSGRVASDVTPEIKKAWGPLAYLRGAAGPIAERASYKLTLRFDGGPPQTVEALNVVVASARTAAGGVSVAPLADPQDGKLDVVIVPAADIADLSVVTARLMEGDYTADEIVTHRRASRVELTSDPPIPFSIDGELVQGTNFTFTCLPAALTVYTGPGYHRNARRVNTPVGVRAVTRRLFGLLGAVLQVSTRQSRVYAAGLLVAVLSATGFAVLAAGVAGGGLGQADEAVRRCVTDHRSETGRAVAAAVTRAGDVAVTTGVAAVVGLVWVARRRYLDAVTLLAVAAGCGLLEVFLKWLFGVPRPDPGGWFDLPDSYSFPSGHALRSVGLYGFFAVVLVAKKRTPPRVLAAAALVLLALGVCWSRVYLGVHHLTDVVGGSLAAVGWVAGCVIGRSFARRRKKRSPAVR